MDDWNDFLESEENNGNSDSGTSHPSIPPVGSAEPLRIPETAAESMPEQAIKKDKPRFFLKALLTGISFQSIICLCLVIFMILLNTFYPRYYTAIENSLKEEFTRPIYMKRDAQQVIEYVSSFLEDIRPSNSGNIQSSPSGSDALSSSSNSAEPSSNSGSDEESKSAEPPSVSQEDSAAAKTE